MGRNEIRLRRQKMSAGRIAQHRNYREIMARHERDVRIRRTVRVFIYFLIIAFLLFLFFMVKRWEQKQGKPAEKTAWVSKNNMGPAGLSSMPQPEPQIPLLTPNFNKDLTCPAVQLFYCRMHHVNAHERVVGSVNQLVGVQILFTSQKDSS